MTMPPSLARATERTSPKAPPPNLDLTTEDVQALRLAVQAVESALTECAAAVSTAVTLAKALERPSGVAAQRSPYGPRP